ncbi:MAG: tetratricopeptide repeat protein [Gemmatimonadetes bacterium]|nr:tetratricopeptide repeat protein [Gemmatimonadota bacterium]
MARDSAFARAWAGLAQAEILLALFGTTVSSRQAWPRVQAAAHRAIALDSTLAEAHAALAYGTMLFAWDWAGAERGFRRAILADPRYPTAHHWYGDFLAGRGRWAEAYAEMTRARELDPLSRIIAVERGWTLTSLGRYDEAEAALEDALRLDPNYAHAHILRGWLRIAQQRYPAAIADLRRGLVLGGFYPHGPVGLIRAFTALGQPDSAQAELAALRARARAEGVPPIAFAGAFAALGQRDSAFAWLERGIAERDGFLPENFFDPMFAPLTDDPRYAPIATRIRGR